MILIVDDKRENILPLQKILSIQGMETDSAESGEEALLKILKNDYSLVILDVQMPGMDGFEVAETLAGSNRTKDIPVIFLSAINKEKKYISKGYASGGVDYITKPVDPDLLILKVKTFVKLYEQQQQLRSMKDLLSKEIEIRKNAQQELTQMNERLEQKVKERTSELTHKNEELELSNHELQQFSWVVSHDLKEPLRKIEIFLKIIRDKYINDNETAKDYIARTILSAERMKQLISDLLEYSRLSSTVTQEITDLNQIVDEVLFDFDLVIEQKNATVTVQTLPSIMAVTGQIRQVFQNLLSNALKFSKPDTAPLITISTEFTNEKSFTSSALNDGPYCRISIIDNGIGFDNQYLDKIFIIFQGLNARDLYEGTGIGLAIVKKIIEKHHGLVTATSQPSEGATFTIVLPVAPQQQ